MIPRIRTAWCAGLSILLAGCAGTPQVNDSSLGTSRISILDGDATSRRYILFLRTPDGSWFQGGGKDALEGMAPRSMTLSEADRKSILDAFQHAGWLDARVDAGSGTGPRYLEVKMSGGAMNQRFSMLATDGGFDPGTEKILGVLNTVAEKRFQGVLDALPQGRPSEP